MSYCLCQGHVCPSLDDLDVLLCSGDQPCSSTGWRVLSSQEHFADRENACYWIVFTVEKISS
uniref:Uncharacterized protein n=1 Tax=Rhizophora mucronata TaxID=61149 RepID=A0A2P2QIT4_RHIMU